MPRGESVDDPIEQPRRQEAVIVTVTSADLPDIIAGPPELVALRNDDPRSLVIKSEMVLDRDGNFNRAGGVDGRRMRDRKDDNDRCVIRGAFDSQHDHTPTIFAPFVTSRFTLMVPQTGTGYDETRFRCGYRHVPVLFRFEQRIEMRVPLVHV
jgi:hypothetical protein